jgi:ABC-type nitrate/sulfonate/bicarbonate transport system substrate-binding protein
MLKYHREERAMKQWKLALLATVAMLSSGALLAGAARAEHIKVGTGPVTASGPLYIAQDKGYFAAENLDAEMVSLDAAQSVAQGVVAGDLDVGATAATAAAYNLAASGGLKIIGGQGREVPTFHGSAFLASNKAFDAGLTTLKGMEHHTVGIVQIGGPIHYEVELAAEKYNVDTDADRAAAGPLQSRDRDRRQPGRYRRRGQYLRAEALIEQQRASHRVGRRRNAVAEHAAFCRDQDHRSARQNARGLHARL